jgi:hypothetical protein
MKHSSFIILSLVVVAVLLLLWGGTDWLQSIYLWIAELENSARGVDGITEASRVKVMDDAVRHFPILKMVYLAVLFVALLLFCLYGKRRLYRKK